MGLGEYNSSDSRGNKRENLKSILKTVKNENRNKLVFAHLNINSIRNKFDFLRDQIKGNIDVLMVSETKLDASFPIGNFIIDGFSTPYRLDRNAKGGGIMLYVREDIPSNLLATENSPLEGLYIELNLKNKKWLINCSYNPHRKNIEAHLAGLSKRLDLYSSSYENFLLLGDFNVSTEENQINVIL